MKLSSSLLVAYLAFSGQSSAFVPSSSHINSMQKQMHDHIPTALYQTDPERKRDKVRSLIVNTANKAASLSKSVLNKGGAPIANVLKDAAAEGGGVASEKLIEVLNRIEHALDRVEGEVNTLRGELIGVRNVLTSSVARSEIGVQETEVSSTHDASSTECQNAVQIETSDSTTQTEMQLDLSTIDLSTLKYEDIDYTLTDMAPPFINEDECLVPGEPLVRVEKAPQNSRRIFAGIDIPVSVDEVWDVSFVRT
jgi:hypothetical protein